MSQNTIFSNEIDFEKKALEMFYFQSVHNEVYREFIGHLGVNPKQVKSIEQIPFLPISFFKTHQVTAFRGKEEQLFLSSATTGSVQSRHYVKELALYQKSFQKGFEYFYGNIKDYVVLALLPAYLERKGSSLVYMVDDLIQKSEHKESGFYLHDLENLANTLQTLDNSGKKILLIGVSFALLDLVEQFSFQLKNTIIMETGGMKGRRKELIREELHAILCDGFGVSEIHSEYGMTELLSQGYSKGNGIFECPSWMKIMIRDTEDALTTVPIGQSGGINVIDLANQYSCSFIATQDLGKCHTNGSFEVLGRFDNSDIRGCNLMVAQL
ncbi:MAG: acyl transferase [Flavobacteriaceae bacterium]|nr:acyl transferase [Flavobacteriaceae bacterium]